MAEIEGVIKYSINHIDKAIDPSISLSEINAWRTVLFKLQLIGQQKNRYEGYGFGNISQRIHPSNTKSDQFLISGTQTGGIAELSSRHYCQVLNANPNNNHLDSLGLYKPSSEALTHASVYLHDNSVQAVIHVHSPEIWNNTAKLELPCTAANIAYGTPEMASEVARLLQSEQLKQKKIFTTLGHIDGVIAYADNMEQAAQNIIKYYAKAIALEQTL